MSEAAEIARFLAERRPTGQVPEPEWYGDYVEAYVDQYLKGLVGGGCLALVRHPTGSIAGVMTAFRQPGPSIWIEELAATTWAVVPVLWDRITHEMGRPEYVGWHRDRENKQPKWWPIDGVERRLGLEVSTTVNGG